MKEEEQQTSTIVSRKDSLLEDGAFRVDYLRYLASIHASTKSVHVQFKQLRDNLQELL